MEAPRGGQGERAFFWKVKSFPREKGFFLRQNRKYIQKQGVKDSELWPQVLSPWGLQGEEPGRLHSCPHPASLLPVETKAGHWV